LLLLFLFICVQVMIFLLLSAMPIMDVSGRSRPMRAGFPIRTRMCRSSEDAHSFLQRRVCVYRERWTLPQNSDLSFKLSFGASSFINSNAWYLICNNFNLNFIWYCMLICVVFMYSRFIDNPPIWSWEANPSFLRWFSEMVLSQAVLRMTSLMSGVALVRRVNASTNLF
jgi:hypothetical protein